MLNLLVDLFRIVLYYPFLNLLTFFTWLVPGHNIAWGIILLTLLVRVILLIPTKRQAESQRKMMQINPLLEELKKEYGDDKQGLAVAQMELYKKNGINPFGSCLFALIQFPILIILYRAIATGITANTAHLYSWLPQPSHITSNFLGINLLQPDHYFILPVLAAVTQYIQVRMMLPAKHIPTPEKPQEDSFIATQRNMSYMMPLITLLIAQRFPAGVALYWVVSTLFSIAQQRQVVKQKFEIAGVQRVLKEAKEDHPEYHRPAKIEKEIVEETSTDKKGVTVTVRRKGTRQP